MRLNGAMEFALRSKLEPPFGNHRLQTLGVEPLLGGYAFQVGPPLPQDQGSAWSRTEKLKALSRA